MHRPGGTGALAKTCPSSRAGLLAASHRRGPGDDERHASHRRDREALTGFPSDYRDRHRPGRQGFPCGRPGGRPWPPSRSPRTMRLALSRPHSCSRVARINSNRTPLRGGSSW